MAIDNWMERRAMRDEQVNTLLKEQDPENDQTATLSRLVQELQMHNASLRTDLERLRSGMQRIIDNLNAPRDKDFPRY